MRKLVVTLGFSKYPVCLADQFDTVFYGRYTYEIWRRHNPYHEKRYQTPGQVDQMRKYVFSRTLKHVPGNGMIIGENFEWEVNRIKDEEGKSIWLFGGAGIIESFLQQRLIDECWIPGDRTFTRRKFLEIEAVNTRQPLIYQTTFKEYPETSIHLYKPIYNDRGFFNKH
ncbi:MAG TPA: dihydrofolate reductase family protein [Chryseosolibacter sp.]|nr:dihydrofolate reductase family protein [Chryseosolibacter sp.]